MKVRRLFYWYVDQNRKATVVLPLKQELRAHEILSVLCLTLSFFSRHEQLCYE